MRKVKIPVDPVLEGEVGVHIVGLRDEDRLADLLVRYTFYELGRMFGLLGDRGVGGICWWCRGGGGGKGVNTRNS